jgi:Ca2+/H+ antiporter, TMEM165/GDT1 family
MSAFSLSTIILTFGVIFLAELPDKTAFASLILATRYRVRDVILGTWLAFLVQTLVAVVAGSLLHLLPAKPVHIVAGLGFLVFAWMAFRENLKKELTEEEKIVREETIRQKNGFIASFFVVFAAEWGDLSQLATAALIADSKFPASVAIGAVGALWSVTLIAAFAGAKLTKTLPREKLNIFSGILFVVIGLIVIASVLV